MAELNLARLSNAAAEEEVLGACLLSASELYRVADSLSPDCFTDPGNRRIWETMMRVRSDGQRVDIPSVSRRFFGDSDMLVKIASLPPNPTCNGSERVVAELLHRRRMAVALERAQATLYDFNVSAEEAFAPARAEADNTPTAASEVSIADACGMVTDRMFANQSGHVVDIPTGFAAIDRLGGLHVTDLVVVAGETSMGKTALTLTMALNAAAAGVPVGVVSLEMSEEQMAARLIARKSGVGSRDILYSKLTDSDYNRVGEAMADIRALPLWMDYKSRDMYRIEGCVRRWVYHHKVRLAVVDYLQNIPTKNAEKQHIEYGRVCAALKNLAAELGICILLVSQLSRGDRDDPYPTLSRLKGSGDIENAADTVLLVFRPEYYKRAGRKIGYRGEFKDVAVEGTAEIIMAKGRNTGTGAFMAAFDGRLTSFTDLPQDNLPKKAASNGVWTPDSEEMPF